MPSNFLIRQEFRRFGRRQPIRRSSGVPLNQPDFESLVRAPNAAAAFCVIRGTKTGTESQCS